MLRSGTNVPYTTRFYSTSKSQLVTKTTNYNQLDQ